MWMPVANAVDISHASYKAKNGDTLSEILWEYITSNPALHNPEKSAQKGKPSYLVRLYGKTGVLQEAMLLNPHIKNSGDLIVPGTLVQVPQKIISGSVIAVTKQEIHITKQELVCRQPASATSEVQPQQTLVPPQAEPKAEPQKPDPKPEPLPPHEKPEPPEEPVELELTLGAGYGMGLSIFKQSGPLGAVSASVVVPHVVSVNAGADYGKWFLQGIFQTYTFSVNTNLYSTAAKEDKNFREFGIRIGRGVLYSGIHVLMQPTLALGSSGALNWVDTTYIGATLGARFEKHLTGPKSGRPTKIYANIQAEYYPLVTAADGGALTASSSLGFGARGRIGGKKGFFVESPETAGRNLFIGLEGGASYRYNQFNGTFSTSTSSASGTVKRDAHEYLIQIMLELGM